MLIKVTNWYNNEVANCYSRYNCDIQWCPSLVIARTRNDTWTKLLPGKNGYCYSKFEGLKPWSILLGMAMKKEKKFPMPA